MLLIKVVPENHEKILSRCTDVTYRLLKEHEAEQNIIPYYITPMGWIDKDGKRQRSAMMFREDELDTWLDLPFGKFDNQWFHARRRKTS